MEALGRWVRSKPQRPEGVQKRRAVGKEDKQWKDGEKGLKGGRLFEAYGRPIRALVKKDEVGIDTHHGGAWRWGGEGGVRPPADMGGVQRRRGKQGSSKTPGNWMGWQDGNKLWSQE